MPARVGQALREARTERGIELSEVEEATKIRVKFLRAMEEDRWEELPAPAYVRGFIAAYARFLGLDDQALVDQYRRTVKGADRVEPIPPTVVKRGTVGRRRSVKSVALLLTGLAAILALGLVIVGSLGGSDDGGDVADRREESAADSAAPGTTTDQPRPAPGSEVSVELRSTGAVWVCLVDEEGRAQLNGETLSAGEVRGPFEGRAFEVTFGNGSVEMTVDGGSADIPPLAEPLGYRITPGGVRRLDPSARPNCL